MGFRPGKDLRNRVLATTGNWHGEGGAGKVMSGSIDAIMKQTVRKPAVPRTARETIRHAVIDLLRQQTVSAKDISALVHIEEKEVYGHLEHIRLSIHTAGWRLEVTPAECKKCGFVFAKRERLTPPGKCPVCRHEAIFEPLFTISTRQENVGEKG